MKQLEVRLEEVARDTRPDIIHAHSPVLNALPAIKVARKLEIPVVYEIRAFWEDAAVDHGSTSEGSLRYRATRRLETRAIKQVDHVFTICEGLRADIVGRGIPPGKVTVIPNAVDIDSFQLSGPPDPATAGTAGASPARPWSASSAPSMPTRVWTCCSTPCRSCCSLHPERARAAGRRRPAGRQPSASRRSAWAWWDVIFTGRVPHKEVNRYYDLIDVLAYPRHPMRLTELVTPLKPLEAMAQGQLFVASDVGGHQELVEDKKTGILFQAGSRQALAQAILELLDNRDRWPELRANGRRFVESIRNWKNSVANYREPYLRLVEKH
jgi:glycogen(starch) synthase